MSDEHPEIAIDMAANISAVKWSRKELAGRLIWATIRPLFRFSPRQLWGWRRWLLRLFGAKIADNVGIHPTAKIAIPWLLEIGEWSIIGDSAIIYNLGKITIGRSVTISQYAHLCAGTHDFRDPAFPLLKLPITIEDQAWVCAGAFIAPNVTVSEAAVIGACAVLTCDAEPWMIYAGNPAKALKKRVMRSR